MLACPRRTAGFTLIELLVALVIAGILLAVAVPNYQAHVRRGYRAEALAALLEAQHFMARHHSVYGSYLTVAGTAPALPARLQSLPNEGAPRYALTLAQTSATGYTLHAAPVGVMAADACGVLTLTHTGVKGSALEGSVCWR